MTNEEMVAMFETVERVSLKGFLKYLENCCDMNDKLQKALTDEGSEHTQLRQEFINSILFDVTRGFQATHPDDPRVAYILGETADLVFGENWE